MRILVSGATGFIGSALCSYLTLRGHDVFPLNRGDIPPKRQVDAVVHLAGEPISLSRWGPAKMKAILMSRKEGTRDLIASLPFVPKVFISASAVGYYGNRDEELLSETSGPGKNFLSEVCIEWEKEARLIEKEGVRAVQTRFGIVLGPKGGVLKKIQPLFQLGLGAILGDGTQWMSWISLADLIHAVEHLLLDESARGPFNLSSPYCVRQEDFAKTLAALIHRPVWLKVPSWVLLLALGRSAEEVLLVSARMRPTKLLDAGFTFRYPQLEDALRSCF